MTARTSRPADSDVLPPAVVAFDAVAPQFDQRYGQWASVRAQRRAVQKELLRAFPPDAALLELGGGTGDDAIHLASRGRRVLLTDGSRSMLACAQAKIRDARLEHRITTHAITLERLRDLPRTMIPSMPVRFDGAYSNFAAFNCITDLAGVASDLADLLRPGAPVLLVIFGPVSVGEVLVQLWKGDARAAFRRLSSGDIPARVAGREFTVRYPSPRQVADRFAPWFRLVRTRGVGIFVPPSAAEPSISRFPRLLAILEALDRGASAPLALLADHVLLQFERV
ncbi:MAG: class I SAM-dependent methyltransferase [Gemmatimonadetes bacterium]|nr:class I SAM-dependent methyltransferase [Gemmatimonadota bacterium]